MDNSTKPAGTNSGPVRTRRVSLPHNAKPYERKRPSVNKKKQSKEDEPEGLFSMLKTVITKPLGWIYRGTQPQPTTTTTTTKEQNGNVQETVAINGFNLPEAESQLNSFSFPCKETSPPTSPRRKPSTQSLYTPKPVVLGSRKTLTLATSPLQPNQSPMQPKTRHELMIERVAAIPTPIRLKQANPPSADSMDSMECEDSTPTVPINDFNARMSAFFQSKGNAPLTDEERQLILESVGQSSSFAPEVQDHLGRQKYMSSEIPNSSSYANQSPFVTRKRAFPISPTLNAPPQHMQHHQPSYPDLLRSTASSSTDYGGHVVESVPGTADRFGGSRMDVDRRYDLGERPGKRRDLRSNEERRRLHAMNEYAGNQDSFNAATAERIIQSLQRDNRTPLLDARRAPSSMYSRKGLTDPRNRRGQRDLYPMEELPPSRPLATPILPPSRRTTGPYTKDRRAVKQRSAALAAARKETDEDSALSLFSSSVSAAVATPSAAQSTPKKKTSATAAQMLAGIPMKSKGSDRLLKSTSRSEDEDMEVDSGVGNKKNATREITITGEASRAFFTKPPSALTGAASTTESLFNFTSKPSTVSMTPTPLAAAVKPKQVDTDAMDEGDEDGKKQQGFSKRVSLKAKPAPRIPPKREKRGFSAEEDVEVDKETIARENALKEIPALPIGNLAFAMKPSEPGVFKIPGLPASASNKPAESFPAASTPFKIPTTTDSSSEVPSNTAPVTPATFAMVSPSKTTSPFANLTSTTPAAPPPTSSLYVGPAPVYNFANVPTSNGTDASTTVTAAKADTAPAVSLGLGTPAVTSQPSTLSAISTTPFGTPTVSKTSPSLFGMTNASAAPPALPVFSIPAPATATPAISEAGAINTSNVTTGPLANFAFGKPVGTAEPEVSAAASTATPSIASEVKATSTPAAVAFNFGTPVKPDAKVIAPSTPEDSAEMQMSPAQTPTSGSTAIGPPAISFGPPAISGGFNFSSSTTQPPSVTATAAPSGFSGFAFNKPAGTTAPASSGTGFAFNSASTTATGGSGTTFVTPTSTSTSAPPSMFTFSSTAASEKTPASGFGAPVATSSTLSFGSTTTATPFTFGSTPAATSSAASPYTFGAPSASVAGGTSSAASTTTASPFNFGSSAATSNSAPANAFSFAGAAKKGEAATPFTFGSGTPSTTTTTTPSTSGFSFANNNATGAKTTFGGSAGAFGTASSTTAAAPAASTLFTFGQSNTGVTPSSAVGGSSGFGSGFGGFGGQANTGSAGVATPSAGFGFGGTSTGASTNFQFSGGTTAPMQGGGGGGGGFGSAPMPFSFGATPTAPQSNVVSGTSSFQFGTGVPNTTGAFSFPQQQQQQQPGNGAINSTATQQQPFGFAFGAPQASTPGSTPQGGMTPFAFGAPSATGPGEQMFSLGTSSSSGGGAKSGRPIAKPRSKRR